MTRLLVTRVVVKGGPGSGNFGHAGRPGQVGGSAPGEGEGGDARGQVEAAVRRQFPDAAQAEITETAQQYLDVMSLSREHFLKYAGKLGIKDAETLADEFFAGEKERERKRLQEKWEREIAGIPDHPDGGKFIHAGLSSEMQAIANKPRPERTVAAMAETLRSKYGVELRNTNGTDEARIKAEVGALLNIADNSPAVAYILKDKAKFIDYRDRRAPGSTATAEWIDATTSGINVYPASDFVKANDGVMPAGTWVHELGHGAEKYMDLQEWIPISNRDQRRVSMYAWSNEFEDFAETFTMLYGGHAATADRWVPERAKFVRSRMPWEKKR